MGLITRIKSAIGLEARSTIGVNGWPVPLSATSVTPATAQGVPALPGVDDAPTGTATPAAKPYPSKQ